MKTRSDEILAAFEPVLNVSTKNIIVVKLDTDEISDQESKQIVVHLHNKIGMALRALFDLHTVCEDMVTTYHMAKRYPWHGSDIKKSDHLRLVWFQFLNLCYLFRNKTKLLLNALQDLGKFFPDIAVHKWSVADELKVIDRRLGDHIRSRGANTHEWTETHSDVQRFSIYELVDGIDEKTDWQSADHYRDAKNAIQVEVVESVEFAEDYYLRILQNSGTDFVALIEAFDKLLERLKEHGIVLRAGGLSKE